MIDRRARIRGLLLGLAVGDAVGLPAEGLKPTRIARRFPGPLRHRLVAGRGMISDDTEHAVFTAQALLAHPDDAQAFRAALAWKLRWWFLGLPAGIGLATLRACLRLWLGFRRSGVYSAGNGPGMRAPVVGAAFADDPVRLEAFVQASTDLTHTDRRALTGALAVARMAAFAVREDRAPSWPEAQALLAPLADAEDAEWPKLLLAMRDALDAGLDVPGFAARLGLDRGGVTGYVYHTAPVAVFAFLRHGSDYRAAIEGVVAAGGDTDSVAAQAGALCGALAGDADLPADWVAGLTDWPRGVGVVRALGERLADLAESGRPQPPVRYFWPGLVPRNLVFVAIVLAHGVRRLFPPY